MRWQELVEENRWWREGISWRDRDQDLVNSMVFQADRRQITLETGQIYVIRGARRTGKTVYLKRLIEKRMLEGEEPRSILYVSCDRLVGGRRELLNIINNFKMSFRPAKMLILLDEVTYLRDWYLVLKELAERREAENMTAVATGSNPVRIKQLAERLPGRRIEGNEYIMPPLTFRQYVRSIAPKLGYTNKLLELGEISLPMKDRDLDIVAEASLYLEELQNLFRCYLLTGGFPEAINNYIHNRMNRIDREKYEIVARWVLGDIAKLGLSEDIALELLREITGRESYGQRTNLSSIGSKIGHPHNTVANYIETLEDAFILTKLDAVEPERWKVRWKAPKKLYLTDPFIYHMFNAYFRAVDPYTLAEDTVNDEEICSKLVEGIVASHIILTRLEPYLTPKEAFTGYAYNRKEEVDIVFKSPEGEIIGIEVRYRGSVGKRVSEMAGVKVEAMLTREEYDLEKRLIPTSLLLALLPRSPKTL